jgi:hypothetical protein
MQMWNVKNIYYYGNKYINYMYTTICVSGCHNILELEAHVCETVIVLHLLTIPFSSWPTCD